MLEKAVKQDRTGIQVIARAAAILRALKDQRAGLSLGQIAAVVGLPRSTVQRIIGALASERLVISDPGGGVRLGPELGALAEAATYNIVERCRLILTELTQETGETTDLAVARGAGMIFLDQVPGLHRLRTVSSVGEVFPLTTTANGRACLALMPAKDAHQLVEQEWRRTDTRGDMNAMSAMLDEIRDAGLAYDIDEHTIGISAIGFAFCDRGSNYHAISVPVPSTRFEEARPIVEKALFRAKEKVAQEFAARLT